MAFTLGVVEANQVILLGKKLIEKKLSNDFSTMSSETVYRKFIEQNEEPIKEPYMVEFESKQMYPILIQLPAQEIYRKEILNPDQSPSFTNELVDEFRKKISEFKENSDKYSERMITSARRSLEKLSKSEQVGPKYFTFQAACLNPNGKLNALADIYFLDTHEGINKGLKDIAEALDQLSGSSKIGIILFFNPYALKGEPEEHNVALFFKPINVATTVNAIDDGFNLESNTQRVVVSSTAGPIGTQQVGESEFVEGEKTLKESELNYDKQEEKHVGNKKLIYVRNTCFVFTIIFSLTSSFIFSLGLGGIILTSSIIATSISILLTFISFFYNYLKYKK